jgi:hypothetical protein
MILLLQAVLFCAVLRWQPFHTRLQMPLFLMSIPFVCYAANVSVRFYSLVKYIAPICIAYAFGIVVFNNTRPLCLIATRYTQAVSLFDSRYKKFFSNHLSRYEDYNKVKTIINQQGFKNIGLILGSDDWEYPLFNDVYNREIYPIHLMVQNITKKITMPPVNIDCIVSTFKNVTAIEFNGRLYYNQDSSNNSIWLYK